MRDGRKAGKVGEERLTMYMPSDLRARVRRAANVRKTKEAATMRLMIEKGLEWWEELPTERKEAV